jgi:hypothetical protein
MREVKYNEDGTPKPCVPIFCPPLEEFTLEFHIMTPEEIEEFYASGKTIF